MRQILEHELMLIPISLADTNGTLRTGSKASCVDCLTSDVSVPCQSRVKKKTHVFLSMGKQWLLLQENPTFGDLANSFLNRVISVSVAYDRVGDVFDRYRDNSIKASTIQRRSKTAKPNPMYIAFNNAEVVILSMAYHA